MIPTKALKMLYTYGFSWEVATDFCYIHFFYLIL